MGQQTVGYMLIESSELGEIFKCTGCNQTFSVRIGQRIDDQFRQHITEANLLTLDE